MHNQQQHIQRQPRYSLDSNADTFAGDVRTAVRLQAPQGVGRPGRVHYVNPQERLLIKGLVADGWEVVK